MVCAQRPMNSIRRRCISLDFVALRFHGITEEDSPAMCGCCKDRKYLDYIATERDGCVNSD